MDKVVYVGPYFVCSGHIKDFFPEEFNGESLSDPCGELKDRYENDLYIANKDYGQPHKNSFSGVELNYPELAKELHNITGEMIKEECLQFDLAHEAELDKLRECYEDVDIHWGVIFGLS